MNSWHRDIPSPAYEKLYVKKAFFEEEVAKQAESTPPPTPPRSNSDHPPRIALIDMNSYFAVLEQQANPFLRGKPVGVVKDAGRTCIIAASKEAKQKGVKTGMSLYDAKKLTPNIITVPADFDKYFYNTKLLKKIFESLSPNVEVFSLDEAFIDLTGHEHLYPTYESFFNIVRRAVHTELGRWVTFSLGFGRNRLQAKLASDFAAVDNWFAITEENLSACLAEAKVEDICGIGFRLTQKLHRLQIFHPYQLNFHDDEFLIHHFGIFWGPELRRIGQGKNSHLLDLVDRPVAHMKSVGRSKTLFKSTHDREYIRQLIYNLAEDMCFKARRMQLAGQHIYLGLRDTDHHWYGGEIRLKSYVRHTDEVVQFLNQIFDQVQFSDKPIIKASVRLANLKPLREITQCWLPEWEKREKVFSAIDKINEKHGLYTVKTARLTNFEILMPEVTGFLGDKVYQFGNNV